MLLWACLPFQHAMYQFSCFASPFFVAGHYFLNLEGLWLSGWIYVDGRCFKISSNGCFKNFPFVLRHNIF